MNTPSDSGIVLDLIEAFRRSKTMFTAVRLGIFDRLEDGPQSAHMLAESLKLNAGALTRLLDGCVGLGLLLCEAGRYRNSAAASRYLSSRSPDTLSGYIAYSDQSLYALWAHMDDAVREGTNRWEQAFGNRNALFDHYFRDDAATRNFLGGMHGFGQISSRNLVRAFDLGAFTQLADLGGATGHLAIAACEAYPNLCATVFDLPRVEPYARAHIASSSAKRRVNFIAGDFFVDQLPPADIYCLGRIIHDWSEPKIALLLQRIFEALPRNGALLIAEALLDEDRSGPVYALMQDLNMLVCTEGKERTPGEYSALLGAAGFGQVEYRRTGSVLDAVLARKI